MKRVLQADDIQHQVRGTTITDRGLTFTSRSVHILTLSKSAVVFLEMLLP
jgi:hypothetical protein